MCLNDGKDSRLYCVRYLLFETAQRRRRRCRWWWRRATTSLVCYMDVFHRSTILSMFFLSLRRFVQHAQAHKTHSHLPQNNVFGLCQEMTSTTHYVQIMLKYSYYRFISSHLNAIIQSFLDNLFVWMFRVCCALVRWCVRNKFAAFSYFYVSTFFFLSSFPIFHYQRNATSVIDIYTTHK